MVVTLLVRHLPDGLPPHTLTRLFTHYGASETRPCAGGRLKNCAFVDFNSDGLAARAQSQLHRLRFLGKTLTVERANPVTEKQDLPSDGIKKEKEEGLAPPLPPYPPLPQAPPLPSVDSGAPTPTVVSTSGGESIAPTLGVDYPFPPHLEYAYPPPDGDILTNIVNCLIAVPRFYTQVLHLMNKMNIPAPFRPALPTPPLPPPAPLPAPPKRQEGDLSSGESELESSNEEDDDMEAMNEETKNSEEAEPQLKRAKKRAKREAIVGPAVDKTTSHEAAGVKPIHITPKANLIRKNKPVIQIKITPKGSASGGGSDKHSQDVETVVDASIEEVDITNRAATLAELEAGKVAPTDILSLPMFKNYTPGNATQVLYIKNLAKEVTLDDLHFVYGAFFESLEDAKATLSIKLMQEGRMRDQAFITFPSTQLAEHALGMTHGYMLKGKPMIVQFGRNPFAAKNPPAT